MSVVLSRVTRINGRDSDQPRVILDDVSVMVPAGVNIGIMGLRGVGKSTLINLLSGSLPVTAGRIVRSGSFSFPVSQPGGISRRLTGRQNIRVLARMTGADEGEVGRFVEVLTGLGEDLDMPVYSYSSDKRSRFNYALAYALPFDTYLADEALAGGPVAFRQKLMKVVTARLAHSGLILASRSAVMVRNYCDVAGILHDGKLHIFSAVDDAVKEFRDLERIAARNPSAQPIAA